MSFYTRAIGILKGSNTDTGADAGGGDVNDSPEKEEGGRRGAKRGKKAKKGT